MLTSSTPPFVGPTSSSMCVNMSQKSNRHDNQHSATVQWIQLLRRRFTLAPGRCPNMEDRRIHIPTRQCSPPAMLTHLFPRDPAREAILLLKIESSSKLEIPPILPTSRCPPCHSLQPIRFSLAPLCTLPSLHRVPLAALAVFARRRDSPQACLPAAARWRVRAPRLHAGPHLFDSALLARLCTGPL